MDDVELATRLSNVDKKGKKDAVKPGEVSGLEIDGRKLNISRAIPKDSADDINKQKTQQTLKDRDKRNLYLMMEGHVSKESEAAKTMPENHLRKIEANFQAKKKKLDNPIFHVSRTRLAVQNLPKTMDVKALRELFLEHAQDDEHGTPVIKQCKIVHEKDPNLKNVELGSKGFGFVEFTKHEHALKALRELNNNPNIFESENPADKKIKRKRAALEVNNNRRLIVEFAVENTMKLHKLKEHMAKSNRTKEDKEKMQRQLQAESKLKTKKRKFEDMGSKKKPKGGKSQKRRKK
jgi:nucleolar protein 4